jgi:glutamyl/glutaminyl-tRNA synthetase
MEQTGINLNIYRKTRIAPTPSGFLHLGNVLSFAITAYIAQKNGAQILLRIDDLDRLRINRKYVQDIFDTLNFMEISWDEGPRNMEEYETTYSQLYRMEAYSEAMNYLKDKGLLYACNCSRKQLHICVPENSCNCRQLQIDLSSDNVNWRLLTNDDAEITVKDYSEKNIKATLPADMHNIIIKKKDGYPSYQLASVIDDLLYEVDLVVRGADLWPSTLVQHQIASALGKDSFKEITFYHHSLLMDGANKKLSKSAGATSVKHLRQNGLAVSAIYSLIADELGINKPINSWRELGGIVFDEL